MKKRVLSKSARKIPSSREMTVGIYINTYAVDVSVHWGGDLFVHANQQN